MKTLTIKHSVVIIAILFSPLSTASNLTSQSHNFFGTWFVRASDKVRVSIYTASNLLPPCDQPLLSMGNNSRLWGNVSMLARCDNDERYLQVNVQATGNHVVAATPIVRGGKLEASNVKLKRRRLDTLSLCTVLNINQLVDAVSLHDLSPDQPIQLAQFRQAWRVKAGQRVNVITNSDGFSTSTKGQALNNVAIIQNARVRMTPG